MPAGSVVAQPPWSPHHVGGDGAANHPDLADKVRPSGTPFIHVPAHAQIRVEAERRQLDPLSSNVDLVVPSRAVAPRGPHHPDGNQTVVL